VGGVAGLAAGALAMAAGEYVSVSSHADTERADLEVERREQAQDSEAEVQELAEIYIGRGVDPPLARQVAQQLMVRDALGAPARDEFGISTIGQPRPLQAAFAASANACFRLAGVIRLAAPSSSCSPQRPQFESSFIARRKSASVAIVGRAFCPHTLWLCTPPTRNTPMTPLSRRTPILMGSLRLGHGRRATSKSGTSARRRSLYNGPSRPHAFAREVGISWMGMGRPA